MGQQMNVQPHNLRRVILPDTPREARVDKVNRPATYYACTCDFAVKGAKSRRQAREIHKLHRMEMLTKAKKAAEKFSPKIVPVKLGGREVGSAYMDAEGQIHSTITDPAVKEMLR